MEKSNFEKSLPLILGNLFVMVSKHGENIYKVPHHSLNWHQQCGCDACETFTPDILKQFIPSTSRKVVVPKINKVHVHVCIDGPLNCCQREIMGVKKCRSTFWREDVFTWFINDHDFKIRDIQGIINKIKNFGHYEIRSGDSLSIDVKQKDEIMYMFIRTSSMHDRNEPCPDHGDEEIQRTDEDRKNFEIKNCPLHKTRFVICEVNSKKVLCLGKCSADKKKLDDDLQILNSFVI